MTKFKCNLTLEDATDIQFTNLAGANTGKIESDGNNLVLSNAVGDILLGDGNSDIYVGDGTNSVDILFEVSGAISAESGAELTLGGSGGTLNLENPNIVGTFNVGATSLSNILTLTGSSSKIVFDYESTDFVSGTAGEYTSEIPLLQVDRSGTPITILSRVSSMGAIALGADDTVAIVAGDTKSMVQSNHNYAAETVILASENGFYSYGWPSNMQSPYNDWADRNEFRFRTDSTTASDNGLYIGVNGSTQFIDTSRNLKNIGTIGSGAITSTAHVSATEFRPTNIVTNKVVKFGGSKLDDSNITDTGSLITLGSNTVVSGELEASSLDINGDADISGTLTVNSGDIAGYFNGTGTSYTQGAIVIQSSNADTPEARGQGVFMFNQGKDSTWYTGTRYNNADEWQVGRAAGTSLATAAATTANAFLKINNAGNATFAGNVTLESANPVLKIDATGTGNPEIFFARITSDDQNARIKLGDNQLVFENEGDPDSTYLFQGRAEGSGSLSDFLKIEDTGITAPGATFAGAISATSYTGTLLTAVTAVTQSAGNDSTKVATTAYVDAQVATIVDSAPGTLNTLNELAYALGDDASFSTTVTNSIATKLPLVGGNMTGAINILTDNSSEAAMLKLEQDGTGDAVIDYVLTSTNLWRVGIDNSSSDAFKWGIGSFDSYERMSLSTAGNLTVVGKVITTEVESAGALLLDAAADITIDAGGGDIILSDDTTEFARLTNNAAGLNITTSEANASLYLTPNGTGNIYATTDTLIINATEGEAARILLRTDEGDDNGDDWYIHNGTDNALDFTNDISGSQVNMLTLTPHATAASSSATFAGTITGTTLTGTSLDINGAADIAGNLTVDGGLITIDQDAAGAAFTWKESDGTTVAGQLRGYANRGDIYLYSDGTKTTELSAQNDSFIPALHIGGSAAASGGVLQTTGNVNIDGDADISGTLTIPGSFATTILDGDNVVVQKPNYSSGGWARALMNFKEYDGTSLYAIGAYGTNNTFSYGYLGVAYNDTIMRWAADKTVTFGGDVTGVGTLTATTLSVTNYGLASGDIPNNAANTSGSSGSTTGNAATATALATARNIGGVSFNGTAAINLPGVNAAGNQNTTGTAAGLSATLAIASGGTAATNSNGWLNSRITTSADGSLNYDAASAVAVNHDSLAGFVAAEHVDWAGSGAGTIHASNYIENVVGNLGVTANGTSLTITTTNGTNQALPAATTSAWGIMTDDHAIAIAANTTKSDLVVDADESTRGIVELATVEEATGGTDTTRAVTAAGVAGYTDAKVWDGSDITSGTIAAARIATLNQDTTGTAAQATRLETARNIGGVSFSGQADINLPGVNTAGNQDTTGEAATVATIAGLAPNTATTQASQPNITGVGTIGTGVWQGTAVASDQQKHLMHYSIAGYGVGDGTNYEMVNQLSGNTAPFEHDTSLGPDGVTATTTNNMVRSAGIVMPRACTLKRWTGWATCNGSGDSFVGLFKVTPTRNNSANLSAVELEEFQFTALGNAKMEDFDIIEEEMTATLIEAGDIIISAIKAVSGKTVYFTSTFEVEF